MSHLSEEQPELTRCYKCGVAMYLRNGYVYVPSDRKSGELFFGCRHLAERRRDMEKRQRVDNYLEKARENED